MIDGFKYDENSDRSIFNLQSFGTENESEIASSKKRLFLYKLHGSLTWKKFSDSKIIKMLYNEDHPQKDAINGITLVSPTRTPKDTESDPPYTELIELFKNRIQDFDVCIVVGYSFRDSLNEKFMDFLSKKEKLLIVISPEATPNIMMNFLKKKIMLSSEIPPEAYKCEQIKEGIQFINEPNILLINNYMSSETIDDILRIICGFLYNGNTDTA